MSNEIRPDCTCRRPNSSGSLNYGVEMCMDCGERINKQIKVTYRTHDGHEASAYITEWPTTGDLHHGTNKHSDAPVSIRSTEDGWIEESTPEYLATVQAWWDEPRNWM